MLGHFPSGFSQNHSLMYVPRPIIVLCLCLRLTLLKTLKKQTVKDRINQLEGRFGGVKLIVGVDRLDYIKGVPQKLHAMELFLTQHPEWIGKVGGTATIAL